MRKGQKHTKEAKIKISENNAKIWLGKKRPVETGEKISLGRLKRKEKLGYLNSQETRKKMSEVHIGKIIPKEQRIKMSKSHKGKKHWNWQGGITSKNLTIRRGIEFRLWREAVFARDNWTCQKCGDNKGGNLNPHHIQNFADFPELRFAIDNGITLCEKCHLRFHSKYGRKNNNEEEIRIYLTN